MNITRPLVLTTVLLAFFISGCSQPSEVVAPTLAPQFGTRGYDYTESLTINKAGHLYVTGRLDASGNLGGDPFLRRYNRVGSLLWETYLDMTDAIDGSSVTHGLATDSYGYAYVAWSYDVEGVGRQSNLAKYTSAGKLLWKKSLPATGIISFVLDGSANIYTTSGSNGDSLITKYTTSGAQLWQRSVANPAWNLAVSQNYIYALRLDGYLEKYNLSGRKLSAKRLVLDEGWPRSIRPGINGELYVLGDVLLGTEPLAGCGSDNYLYSLYKLDSSGTRLWKRTLTAEPTSRCSALWIDSYGRAHFMSSLNSPDTSAAGIVVAKYSRSGSRLWSKEFGTAQRDIGRSLVTYDGSEIFVGGWTYGALAHRNLGNSDAFLRKLDQNGNRVWTR